MCDCRLCKRGEKITAFFKAYPLKLEDEKWLRGIFDTLFNVEDDYEYLHLVLSGDWPSSVEQLTRALEQAKRKETR